MTGSDHTMQKTLTKDIYHAPTNLILAFLRGRPRPLFSGVFWTSKRHGAVTSFFCRFGSKTERIRKAQHCILIDQLITCFKRVRRFPLFMYANFASCFFKATVQRNPVYISSLERGFSALLTVKFRRVKNSNKTFVSDFPRVVSRL